VSAGSFWQVFRRLFHALAVAFDVVAQEQGEAGFFDGTGCQFRPLDLK